MKQKDNLNIDHPSNDEEQIIPTKMSISQNNLNQTEELQSLSEIKATGEYLSKRAVNMNEFWNLRSVVALTAINKFNYFEYTGHCN